MARLKNIHPGEVLHEEFLVPLGKTAYALSRELGMTPSAVGEILKGKRAITAATALRLEQVLGASARFWLNLQAAYDLEERARRQESHPDVHHPLAARDRSQRAAGRAGRRERDTSTVKQKDAEYYLGLNYPIELRQLAPEEGGGWMACIPQLGSHAFVGDGETPAEALDSLEMIRQDLIPRLVEKGVELPEPRTEADDQVDQLRQELIQRVDLLDRKLDELADRAAERVIARLTGRQLSLPPTLQGPMARSPRQRVRLDYEVEIDPKELGWNLSGHSHSPHAQDKHAPAHTSRASIRLDPGTLPNSYNA